MPELDDGKSVVVIATGGTIASTSNKGISYSASLGGSQLLENAGAAAQGSSIEVIDFVTKNSYALTIENVLSIADSVAHHLARPEVSGVVLTMGTAAMEEAAYLLDLLLRSPKPLVLLGAMLSASMVGYDGGRNLADAIKVASDPNAHGQGALVCMAGEVHTAREVQKLHKTSMTSFCSWPNGPIALVDADRTVWLRDARRRITFGRITPVQPVDILKAVLGCDGRQVRFAVDSGCRGLVIEGFPGGGGVTTPMMNELRSAFAAGIPVILTSRSPYGRAVPAAGGGTGPSDLANAGVILGGDLPSPKARLLLMCALAVSSDGNGIRAIFEQVAP